MWDVAFAVVLVIGALLTAFEAGKNDGESPSGLEARSSARATMADDGDTPSGAEVRR
jgi:phosphate/sulfate permease